MKIKKSLFSIVVLLLVFGMKNVYAADVAKIGNDTYSSISSALDAASDGDEIMLLSDITRMEVSADKNVILNLNGYSIDPSPALQTSLNPVMISVKNNGNLTIKGDGKIRCYAGYNCIVNNNDAVLKLENFEMSDSSASEAVILNNGTATLENVFISNDGYASIFDNKSGASLTVKSGSYTSKSLLMNYGTMNLNGGTYNIAGTSTYNSGYNNGNLTINNGTYNLGNDIKNEKILTINDGTFTGKKVASNNAVYSVSNNTTSSPIITVNNANINTTDTPIFIESVTENAQIIINGGTISCSSDSAVLADYTGNIIKITGGTLTGSNSKGIYMSANTILTIGNDDGNVSSQAPVLDIPNGKFYGLYVKPKLNFYDGYINIKDYIDSSIAIATPEGYSVKYDNKSTYYKAYLTNENGESVISSNPGESSNTESEIIKVPDTFEHSKQIFKYFGIVIALIGSAVMISNLKRKNN